MTTTAVWLGSWVRGTAGADDLLEAMAHSAPDAPAVGSVLGAAPTPLPDLLRAIRVSGADGTWLLLPRPGRTVGWPPRADGAPAPAVLLSRGDLACRPPAPRGNRVALGPCRGRAPRGGAGRHADGALRRTSAGRGRHRRRPHDSSSSAWTGRPRGRPPASGRSRWASSPGAWTPRWRPCLSGWRRCTMRWTLPSSRRARRSPPPRRAPGRRRSGPFSVRWRTSSPEWWAA